MLPESARAEFDRLFEEIVAKLPAEVRKLLDEVPILVDDEPSEEMLEELGIDPDTKDTDLCGLHSGIALNQRGLWETPILPGTIHLFRGPLFRIARGSRTILHRQLQITLLHEIGHHFGFDEAKLKTMGYG